VTDPHDENLTDEEIETRPLGATAQASVDDGDDGDDTGDDSGDTTDATDTGDDSGDSA
jgi:hypothetical protein